MFPVPLTYTMYVSTALLSRGAWRTDRRTGCNGYNEAF